MVNTTAEDSVDALQGPDLGQLEPETKSRSKHRSQEPTTSPSPKSESGSKPRPSPRLSVTLKREPSHRLIQPEDVKWVWAAYRKQGLPSLDRFFPEGLKPDQFNDAMARLLDETYCWICEAQTDRGRRPVGLVLARPFVHDTLIMGNMTWFPWASQRNVYESAINLINELRGRMNLLFHVEEHDKPFAIGIARHGIIRRVGTLHYIRERPMAVFQSRPR